jgi:hypothetical protein
LDFKSAGVQMTTSIRIGRAAPTLESRERAVDPRGRAVSSTVAPGRFFMFFFAARIFEFLRRAYGQG